MTDPVSKTDGATASRDLASRLVFDAGLDLLTSDSSPAQFAEFLRTLAAGLEKAAPLDRELARRIVETRFAGLNVPHPGRLVAAGLAQTNGHGPAKSEGQGQVVALKDPDPWPDDVDGADLLEAIEQTFLRFLVLPDGGAVAVALWVLHAHALDSAQCSPILGVTSPVAECGKTTALALIQALAPRPLSASNITASTVFRAVERFRPTLLIDEADTFLGEYEELRGILNSSHFRPLAFVVRTVGDDHEPRTFSTWCAKAVALIGELPATLHGRAIGLRMRRKAPDEDVEELRFDRLGEFEALRRQAWRWATDHQDDLRASAPALPPGIRGRTADNWRPLLAIADLAGGVWPDRARDALQALTGTGGMAVPEIAVQLLADLMSLFEERHAEALSSSDIVEFLGQREDRPWSEWRQGKPITQRQLAKLLAPFRIAPRTVRIGTATPRGYAVEQFADVWSRYSVSGSATDPQHQNVADPPATREAAPELDCCGVADRKGGEEGVSPEDPPADLWTDWEPSATDDDDDDDEGDL